MMLAISAALVLASASGCSRVVLVDERDPIRIGPDAKARVYTLEKSGEWTLSPNEVTIPEGWYAVPPSFVKAEEP
jgi:hypothetical protein